MSDRLVVFCTRGKDDSEKANLAFVIATTAQAVEADIKVFLATDGIFLATKGYVDDIHISGHPPLKELIDLYVSEGGRIYLCTPCVVRRGITAAHLIAGAELVGVAELAVGTSGMTCISL